MRKQITDAEFNLWAQKQLNTGDKWGEGYVAGLGGGRHFTLFLYQAMCAIEQSTKEESTKQLAKTTIETFEKRIRG